MTNNVTDEGGVVSVKLYLTGANYGKTVLLGHQYQFVDGMITIPSDNPNAIKMVMKFHGAVKSKDEALASIKGETEAVKKVEKTDVVKEVEKSVTRSPERTTPRGSNKER